jgi:biopolymer transport protein ExbD
MRKGQHHGQLKWITEISVTPLLDLVFILLFAFMVALPLVSRTDSLLTAQAPVRPATSALPAPTPDNILTLTLTLTGSFYSQGIEYPLTELQPQLFEAVRNRPALGVILEMPPELPVTRLLEPMSTLQKAGVQSTAIRLTPAPS